MFVNPAEFNNLQDIACSIKKISSQDSDDFQPGFRRPYGVEVSQESILWRSFELIWSGDILLLSSKLR